MLIPTLPVELEKEIFQMTAYSRLSSIPCLMLVAHRVKIWVEPLLFWVIALDRSSLPYAYPMADDVDFSGIQSLSTSVLRDSVRHLLLKNIPNTVSQFILSASSAVEDLWIASISGANSFLLPFIGVLPLKRLYCNLGELFADKAQIDFGHPLFSRLTHLELFDQRATDHYFDLALIPHLTHLAFYFPQAGFFDMSLTLLKTCKSLHVLVLLMAVRSQRAVKHEALEDPRFVQMFCSQFVDDWKSGALTGSDYWSRAEDFIARRRSGEIDR
ncbi:hypothetical protein GGX14DRAFT_651548 [Mycena pura]|uniref:Uncharacterized protein n=1 Tax=Mycena pura TaxID=153505 RepID=A0AAD6V9V0_9AGAR|nr:hypothetical protein GGX14DRAFT_651548 [Mycena pura]